MSRVSKDHRSNRGTVTEQTMRQRILVGLLATLVLTIGSWQLYIWLRQPPVVQHDNLHLIQLLRTACSSRRPDYLTGIEKAIQARHEENKLSDTERSHFQKILGHAKQGNWNDADALAMQFEQAQSNRRRN